MAFGLLIMGLSFINGVADSVRSTKSTIHNKKKAINNMQNGSNQLAVYTDGKGRTKELGTNRPCYVTRNMNGDRVIKYLDANEEFNVDKNLRSKEMYRTYQENKAKHPEAKAVYIGTIRKSDANRTGKYGKVYADVNDYHKQYFIRTFEWNPNKITYNRYRIYENWCVMDGERRIEFYMDNQTGKLIDVSDECRQYLFENVDNQYPIYKANADEIRQFVDTFNQAQSTSHGFYYHNNDYALENGYTVDKESDKFFFPQNQY